MSKAVHEPSCEGHQVEERLEDEHHRIEDAGSHRDEGDVDEQQQNHRDGGDAPSEHTVADVLESDQRLSQWVEHGAEPPDALETSCGNATFTLRLLMDVGRAVFQGIGIGCIGDALASLDHVHRQHEIVEQSLVGHFPTELGVDGIEFAGSTHG